MKYARPLAATAFGLGFVVLLAGWAQTRPAALTGTDYAEIEQLIYRYGQDLDTCASNGYEAADLYTPDGKFIDKFTDEGFSKGGLLLAEGREALARASGGGSLGCLDTGSKDWSHLMINPVIGFAPGGATGRVYLLIIGEKGPNDVRRYGGYEDFYVRTSDGWRIKTRTHVRSKAWSNPLLQTPDLN